MIGNRDLDAERIQSFEVGYAGQPAEELPLWARLTTFYNLIDDEIVTVAIGTNAVPVNTGQREAYGLELELDYPFTARVSGFANYSYNLLKIKRTNERVPNGPRNKANVGIDVSLLEGWNARLWFHYFDETEFESGKVGDYGLLNLQLAYRFSVLSAGEPDRDPDLPPRRARVETFLRVFNLLDNRHREHAESQKYGIIAMAGFQLNW